jgi:hypothetical protein
VSGQVSRSDAHGSAIAVFFVLVVVSVVDYCSVAPLEFWLGWASESDSFVLFARRFDSRTDETLLGER